jgi:predicted translin family RNA/ssDNA-binding protein
MKIEVQELKAQAILDLPGMSQESMFADANMAMSRAAESAARLDIGLDSFMQAAFAAYLEANPAVRERVEATHLMKQLDDMRRRGVLATA